MQSSRVIVFHTLAMIVHSVAILLFVLSLAGLAVGDEVDMQQPDGVTIGAKLQSLSVNVLCEGKYRGAQGSGTLFLSEVEDEPSSWVITAHHVVECLREVNSVIGQDGETRKSIKYADAQIIQQEVERGRTVEEVRNDAKIISVDSTRDIALLRVRKRNFSDKGASFYLGSQIPLAGTEIYHCGAPGGREIGGTCSLTSGIISRIGVRIPDFGGGSEHGIFDQTDTAGLGGSSGGMIALKSDGRWIGMITLGLSSGDNFHWIVPARSVRAWAKEIKVEWLLDPSLPRPTEKDISEIVLENIQ